MNFVDKATTTPRNCSEAMILIALRLVRRHGTENIDASGRGALEANVGLLASAR